MQEKSERSGEFSERSEILADALGIGVSDLPDKIGVSRSMFHAYRSGKLPISAKAWRKLESAERAAKINIQQPPPPIIQDDHAQHMAGRAQAEPEPTMAQAFQKLGEALDMLKMLMERMPKDDGSNPPKK